MSNSTTAAAKKELRSQNRLGSSWGRALHQHCWLYVMLIFCCLPMGGLVMAFENFNPYAGGGLINALLATPVPWLKHMDGTGYPPAYADYIEAMEALAREEDIPFFTKA